MDISRMYICLKPLWFKSKTNFAILYIYIPGHPKTAFFWSGLKSSERPSVSHIWKDQRYDAKWRRKDAKNQLFDTKAVSLNPSLLAQKWFPGPRRKIHKDRKLCGSRTVYIYIYTQIVYIYIYTYIAHIYIYVCCMYIHIFTFNKFWHFDFGPWFIDVS